jgi:hypothetical protein
MPRPSSVYEVLIASPSDVTTERTILAEVLEDWNSANSRANGVSLQALRWELDAVPATGDRPQQILNKQLVENADILLAVFWARLGTPTGKAASGTVEEIDHFRQQGKPVLLYFSEQPIPHDHDPEQFRALNGYRKSVEADTIYHAFQTSEELRRHASKDIARVVHELAAAGTATQPSQNSSTPKNQNELARVLFQTTTMSEQGMKVVRVFGTIENTSRSRRIREYSLTLSIPECCLTFNTARFSLEIAGTKTGYRKFRSTEVNHRVQIQPGDRFQIISIDIAVDHLAAAEREKCLQMDVIADVIVEDQALQLRKKVNELFI